MLDLKTFYGPNAGYVLDFYERYKQNPASVDATTRALFETWSPNSAVAAQAMAGPPGTSTQWLVSHVVAAAALAHAIVNGRLCATMRWCDAAFFAASQDERQRSNSSHPLSGITCNKQIPKGKVV